MTQQLWRTVWRFFKKKKKKKLGIKLPYDPAIPLLGIYPKETIVEKDMYPTAHCNIIYNS